MFAVLGAQTRPGLDALGPFLASGLPAVWAFEECNVEKLQETSIGCSDGCFG